MNVDLLEAILLFVASAGLVVVSGLNLAKYGNLLAYKTGWGHLWVGTILVAAATSMPELVTVVSAAWLDSPELAAGNVFGSNMVNMFLLGFVALLFGAREFFNRVALQQGYLAILAIALTLLAVLLIAIQPSFSVVKIGLGAALFVLLYLVGMWLVYLRRPSEQESTAESDPEPSITLSRTWLLFGLASVGVLASAPLLAYSAERIADTTDLSAGFLGLVALAIVTSMPEAIVAVASVRLGAIDLAVGDLYGSNAFNLLALAIADPFYRDGPILSALGGAQVAGGLFAVLLMTLGMAQFLVRRAGEGRLPWVATSLAMCLTYLGGLYVVYILS